MKTAIFDIEEEYPLKKQRALGDAYSEEYQKKLLKKYLQWFYENIGEPGLYVWGIASCVYTNVHGPRAEMGISYEEKRI